VFVCGGEEGMKFLEYGACEESSVTYSQMVILADGGVVESRQQTADSGKQIARQLTVRSRE
jgi:hypothetical protein